jgi:hypothetical protein
MMPVALTFLDCQYVCLWGVRSLSFGYRKLTGSKEKKCCNILPGFNIGSFPEVEGSSIGTSWFRIAAFDNDKIIYFLQNKLP